jgi:hypothetical protein
MKLAEILDDGSEGFYSGNVITMRETDMDITFDDGDLQTSVGYADSDVYLDHETSVRMTLARMRELRMQIISALKDRPPLLLCTPYVFISTIAIFSFVYTTCVHYCLLWIIRPELDAVPLRTEGVGLLS